MVIETLNYVFNYQWSTLSSVFWKKYPHPLRPDIINTELLNYQFENGILKTTRLITLNPKLPLWPDSLFYCLEEITIDPLQKTMVLNSHNLSGTNIITLHETCTYKGINDKTELVQMAQITVNSYFWLCKNSIELWCAESYRKNALLGRDIIESIASNK